MWLTGTDATPMPSQCPWQPQVRTRISHSKRRGQLYIGCICVLCVKHYTSYHKIVNWIEFHDVPLSVSTPIISVDDKVAGNLLEFLHCNGVAT